MSSELTDRSFSDADLSDSTWWRSAVFYQIYIRSFADSNGDGVGDLVGLLERLPYLKSLGIDALWITPFYSSPMADHGYDVADARQIDPTFGDLAAFDAMLAAAHELGIRVTVDVVPNHSSDQHAWFQEALAAAPGSPERDRYIFRDGIGEGPPNNWPSVFGGPAWTQVADGQYYLHMFAPEQPDFNWDNPQIHDDLEQTLRFWLDRGADGFRIDVAHGMAKPSLLPDIAEVTDEGEVPDGVTDLRFDNDGVHTIHRMIRGVVEDYPGATSIGEVWVDDKERLARYIRPNELHMIFNFALTEAGWEPGQLRDAVDNSIETVALEASPACWVLSNHDVSRHATRYGGGELGQQRSRAAALLQLALPGAVFVYGGDELGLEDVDLPDEALQDPTWERSGHTRRGRDAARVPIPWSGSEPPYGFSSSQRTWLPMPLGWGDLSIQSQLGDGTSHLAMYAEAIKLRGQYQNFGDDSLVWLAGPDSVLAFRRSEGLLCVVNFDAGPVHLPPGDVLLTSGALTVDGLLPQDTAAWILGAVVDDDDWDTES